MTTALTEKKEFGLTETAEGADIKAVGEASRNQHEMQAAIIVAKKFPRDEAAAFAKLMKAALRPSFAEDAAYKFPRGGQDVTGPSVNVAREAARVWGNIRYGLEVIRDDHTSRLIRGWAWDMETNTKVEAEDDFKKMIQRKDGRGGTVWLTPDERDLRELTNRRGAILMRNCILQLLPKDLIEDALFQCTATLKDKSAKDPEGTRKRLVVNFSAVNVTPEMIAQKLGHPLAEASPDELAELQGVYTSIKDGNSTWREYTEETHATPIKTKPNGLKDKLHQQVPQEAAAIQPDLNAVAIREHTETINAADTLHHADQARNAADLDKRLTAAGHLDLDKVLAERKATLKN